MPEGKKILHRSRPGTGRGWLLCQDSSAPAGAGDRHRSCYGAAGRRTGGALPSEVRPEIVTWEKLCEAIQASGKAYNMEMIQKAYEPGQ